MTKPKLPPQEELKQIGERIAQLKARKQAIQAKERAQTRKERTRRLIQNGALAEQYLRQKGAPPETMELLLQQLVGLESVQRLLEQEQQN